MGNMLASFGLNHTHRKLELTLLSCPWCHNLSCGGAAKISVCLNECGTVHADDDSAVPSPDLAFSRNISRKG